MYKLKTHADSHARDRATRQAEARRQDVARPPGQATGQDALGAPGAGGVPDRQLAAPPAWMDALAVTSLPTPRGKSDFASQAILLRLA